MSNFDKNENKFLYNNIIIFVWSICIVDFMFISNKILNLEK